MPVQATKSFGQEWFVAARRKLKVCAHRIANSEDSVTLNRSERSLARMIVNNSSVMPNKLAKRARELLQFHLLHN